MSTCLIFNPAARGQKAALLLKQIEESRGGWMLKPTTAPGVARRLAREAVEEGFTTIVAAGGDGTLNEVLNGVVDAPEGVKKARLGLLPLGTINVFARELKLPLDVRKAWEVLERGKETCIDLPCASFVHEGKPASRCFIQLAGAGWDARSIEMVSWELKKKIGPGAYVIAGLQALTSAHSPITISNGQEHHTGELIIIGNGKFYGGSYPVLHKSDAQDGVLDACVFEKVSWQTLPGYIWDWACGKLYKPGVVAYLQGSELTLTSPGRTCLQLEGELVGELPARLTVQQKALRVVVP